jgi:hypothetical protein
VEFNTVNNLALTFGFDPRAHRSVYKVWELEAFTEILTIPADDVIDCKFSSGFLLISTGYDVALDSASKTATIHVPLPPREQHRETRTGDRDDWLDVEAMAESCSSQLVVLRDALWRNDTPAIAAARTRLRLLTDHNVLLAMHFFPVRTEANAMCLVTPIVPACSIQLLELFNDHVMLKQDGFRPRIVHLASGTTADTSRVAESPSPAAQVFMYNTDRSLAVQPHCLEVRDSTGGLLSTLVGLEAAAVRTGMHRCTQTGNNVLPLADETTCLMLGVQPSDEALADVRARDTAPGCVMHMNMATGRLAEVLHTFDRPDSMAATALRGVSVLRYDEVAGVMLTGNAAGDVFVWEEDPDATPAARAAAQARERAEVAAMGPDLVAVDDTYRPVPAACRCPPPADDPHARAPSPPIHAPILSPVAVRKRLPEPPVSPLRGHGDAAAAATGPTVGAGAGGVGPRAAGGPPRPTVPDHAGVANAPVRGGSGSAGGSGGGGGAAAARTSGVGTLNPAHGRWR